MNDLKTPASRLLRLVRGARERWKAKALERQQRLRAAQVRIRDLEHSRAYWKARAVAAEGRVPTGNAGGGDTDGDSSEEPPPARVPTRLTNHYYSVEAIQLSLQLSLHASFGCRGVSWVLRLVAGSLPLGAPVATTVLNWSDRLGLAALQRPPARRDDWIFVVDETVGLGALKCLIVLGIPAGRLAETGYSPRHCEMTVLAVEVTPHSSGVWVAAVLEQVSTRTGAPVQIVADHGSNLRKGMALFRQQAPRCVATDDISHAVAAQLKAHWRDDRFWRLADRGYVRFLEAFDWVVAVSRGPAPVAADHRRVQDPPDGPENPGALARHTGAGGSAVGGARTACGPGGRLPEAGPAARRTGSGQAARRRHLAGVLRYHRIGLWS
jgi:hypothetical protein